MTVHGFSFMVNDRKPITGYPGKGVYQLEIFPDLKFSRATSLLAIIKVFLQN